ncbi:MAG: hypothetical protein Q4C25_07985, partial [Bacillota bacterium]|nr:hypothetical protein [Bacillota bacterium]
MYRIRAEQTRLFNKWEHRCYIFISNIAENDAGIELDAGMILASREAHGKFLNKFISSFEEKIEIKEIEEIPFEIMNTLCEESKSNRFISSDTQIREAFCIEPLDGWTNTEYREEMIYDQNDQKIAEKKKELTPYMNVLKEELERIDQGCTRKVSFGHPVHYMIQADSDVVKKNIAEILLYYLHKNDRIGSKKFGILEFDLSNSQNFSGEFLKAAFDSSRYSALIINCIFEAEEEYNSCFVNENIETIKQLCKKITEEQNHTLIFICLPDNCDKIKKEFILHLQGLALIQIREDILMDDKAVEYLSDLSKEYELNLSSETVKQIVNQGEGHTISDL